jgi:hypothetical protein
MNPSKGLGTEGGIVRSDHSLEVDCTGEGDVMTKPPTPTRSEAKAALTDSTAREIIQQDAEGKAQKTAKLRSERLRREEALDEAFKDSFPASDSVEIGHSEHVGDTEVKAGATNPKSKAATRQRKL